MVIKEFLVSSCFGGNPPVQKQNFLYGKIHYFSTSKQKHTLKTTLNHLPEHKQQELRLLRDVIAAERQVHMVILFGSFATGKWVEDKYMEDGITYTYRSDYDILVITTTDNHATQLRVEEHIKEKCKNNGKIETVINTIYHGINFVNNALQYGNYFFADIKKEGILLFDSGKFKLAEYKELTPEDQKTKMQENFEQWFVSANGFYRFYEVGIEEGNLHGAAFQLHQAVERYYTAILLTFTDYRPKEHNLRELDIKAQTADVRLKDIFPKETSEQEDRFELLVRAYIDARYRMKQYHITKEDLEYLGERVQLLRDMTEKIFRERIEKVGKIT